MSVVSQFDHATGGSGVISESRRARIEAEQDTTGQLKSARIQPDMLCCRVKVSETAGNRQSFLDRAAARGIMNQVDGAGARLGTKRGRQNAGRKPMPASSSAS